MYILKDTSNRVLFFSANPVIADFLREGLINSALVKVGLEGDDANVDAFKYLSDTDIRSLRTNSLSPTFLYFRRPGDPYEAFKHDPTAGDPEFFKSKCAAVMRANYIGVVLSTLEGMVFRTTRRIDPLLAASIGECSLFDQRYTPALLEYAQILGISPDAALQELQMIVDSATIAQARASAYLHKYARIINGARTWDEGVRIIDQFYAEIYDHT